GAANQHLQLAARRHHSHDGSRCLATTPQEARHAPPIRDPRRPQRPELLSRSSRNYERRSATGQRSLRDDLGTSSPRSGTIGVFGGRPWRHPGCLIDHDPCHRRIQPSRSNQMTSYIIGYLYTWLTCIILLTVTGLLLLQG